MNPLFDDKMSSSEARRVFFDYAAAHRGENMDSVKQEYQKVSRQIAAREFQEYPNNMTSYQFQ